MNVRHGDLGEASGNAFRTILALSPALFSGSVLDRLQSQQVRDAVACFRWVLLTNLVQRTPREGFSFLVNLHVQLRVDWVLQHTSHNAHGMQWSTPRRSTRRLYLPQAAGGSHHVRFA